jgi:serine/threonine protein kinase
MEHSGEIPSEKNSPIFDNYEDISNEIEDPRLGLIIPMRPVTYQEEGHPHIATPDTPFAQIFRLERCIMDVEEFVSVIEKADQRLNINHENVIQMLDYCYSPSNEEQSEFLFAGFYEMSDTDLEREMAFRGRQEKQFTDLEIFNLIKETINGLVFLQENNFIHGDLR